MWRDRKWRRAFFPVRDLVGDDRDEHWLVVSASTKNPMWRTKTPGLPNWMLSADVFDFAVEHRSGGGTSGPTVRDFTRGHVAVTLTVLNQTLTVRLNRYYWHESREKHAAKIALWNHKIAMLRAVKRAQGCTHDNSFVWPSRNRYAKETVGLSEGRVAVMEIAGTAHCHPCAKTFEFSEEQMQLMEERVR